MFVHGAAEDSRVWQPQLAAMADEFTVVAWDEPGAGGPSDVLADFGLPDYASPAALIEALAVGPAHVAGLSWGGTVVRSSTAVIPSSSIAYLPGPQRSMNNWYQDYAQRNARELAELLSG